MFTVPDIDNDFGVPQAGKSVLIEAFFAKASIERHNVNILIRLAGLGEK